MNVKNCRRCRRLFNYVVGPFICPQCREEIEKEFQVVKKYIEENPNKNINEVAESCDVDPQQIRQWLREERLQFTDDSAIGLECERCGISIKMGKYCDKCKKEMAAGFNAAIGNDINHLNQKDPEKEKRDSAAKMRFLN